MQGEVLDRQQVTWQPSTDGKGGSQVLYIAVGILWAMLAGAWGYLWRESASKRWVEQRLMDFIKEDIIADRQLFSDLVAPLVTELAALKGAQEFRHQQNQEKLDLLIQLMRKDKD